MQSFGCGTSETHKAHPLRGVVLPECVVLGAVCANPGAVRGLAPKSAGEVPEGWACARGSARLKVRAHVTHPDWAPLNGKRARMGAKHSKEDVGTSRSAHTRADLPIRWLASRLGSGFVVGGPGFVRIAPSSREFRCITCQSGCGSCEGAHFRTQCAQKSHAATGKRQSWVRNARTPKHERTNAQTRTQTPYLIASQASNKREVSEPFVTVMRTPSGNARTMTPCSANASARA